MRRASFVHPRDAYQSVVELHPKLSPQKERELFRRYEKGDEDARRILILSNIGLAAKGALKYARPTAPFADLMQDALIGVIRAVDKFEVDRGFKFSTYAYWWVKQSVQRSAWTYSHMIYASVGNITTLHRIRRATQELSQELGAEPSVDQVAERADMTPEDVASLLAFDADWRSIDAPPSAESSMLNWQDLLPDDRNADPIDALIVAEEADRAMRVVSPRHQEIFRKHYGFDDPKEEGQTFRAMAETMGLTHQRIQQLESNALEAVRQLFGVHQSEEDSSTVVSEPPREATSMENAQLALFG